MNSKDQEAINKYKEMWANVPYPVTFTTTDALVCHGTKLLLIKRGNYPGKGTWAIPGGFLDQGETLRECALRELEEETTLKLDCDDGRWFEEKGVVVFDAPDRDPRGRFITHVHLFQIYGKDEVEVQACDDAGHVEWVDIEDIRKMSEEDFFADHYTILKECTVWL